MAESAEPVRFADLSLFPDHVREGRSIFLGGLPAKKGIVDEAWLRALCEPFGKVDAVQPGIDRETLHAAGFAFVHFADASDARAAIDNLHESEMWGRVVTARRALDRYASSRASSFSSSHDNGGFGSQSVQKGEPPLKRAHLGSSRETTSVVQRNAPYVQPERNSAANRRTNSAVAKGGGDHDRPPAVCGARCRACGGFGVGLVSVEDGLCNHCQRLGR